ncbi:MAG: cyclic nucleotide-binding domain-containing protein [Deltaproteobacteria bacterium]|nr:cyclic nucleotide-binding domain-containing protein [Deltaproteobacteria bacterium]
MVTFSDNELRSFLEKIPLFSSIPYNQLHGIAKLFEPISVKKGEIICKQGESGDTMFIVKSGSVGVYIDREGNEMFVSYLHRGDFFGELSLLTGKARSATIKVILDAKLYRLKQQDFKQLLHKNPSIGLYLSRLYAHRFAESSQQALNEPLPTFFAMTATHPYLGKSHFLYSLAYHLSSEAHKKVLLIELKIEDKNKISNFGLKCAHCPESELIKNFSNKYEKALDHAWFSHPSGFMTFLLPRIHDKQYWKEFETNMPEIMELLRKHFHIIIFNVPVNFSVLGNRVLRLCDKVFILLKNTPDALSEIKEKIANISSNCNGVLDNIKMGVSHLAGNIGIPRDKLESELNLPETPAIWVHKTASAICGNIDVKKRFPIQGPRAVARETGRIRVGLALGAGAARGWAHLGILKVFEEEGIHIDMIAATSMGAVVGSIYARTASVDITKKLTIDQFPTKLQAQRKLFDYTIPLQGIIRGQKILKMVRNALKNADFLDLMIPAYIVAVDINSGEEILLEKGNVSKAVRASISIPGIFNPVNLNGRWLVDGGLLNPVPTDVLMQKGADIVIAVCIEQKSDQKPEQKVRCPNIIGVLSKTINIVYNHATSNFTQKADIVLYPAVNSFAWDDFHKGNELMRVGMETCRNNIDEIKRLIKTGG